MKLIDDHGNLFGAVNVIDALVVLLVAAVAVAGVAFVTTGGDAANQSPERSTTTTTVEVAGVQPYVADALTVGPVETEGIVAIENKSVSATTVVTEDEAGNLHEREHPQQRTVTLELAVETTEQDGEMVFQGEPLEIGRTETLDFGTVSANVTFTALDESS